MKALVIGSGGREHALAWKLRQSQQVEDLFCAGGNAGIQRLAKIAQVSPTDVEALARFADRERIELTVVGPEQPLVDGIVDRFEQNGLPVFGPTKAAARLEGSKVFAKNFMKKYGIPTARYDSFSSGELGAAKKFVDELRPPVVVKADGIASGKGVIICETAADAHAALDEMLRGNLFGAAGSRVVVEEFLAGEEASMFVLTDGDRYAILPSAQDHKRILDGDRGKNTGGMGAYAPAPLMTPELQARVELDIVKPTLSGMKSEGCPYRGCLYVGLMVSPAGPYVLEYNCRFGDPETQAVLPLIESDFAELLQSVAVRRLEPATLRIRNASAVCVVMASAGYPDAYETGKPIAGLENADAAENIVVFHAGTKLVDDHVLTSGGRVLGVTAIGGAQDLPGTIRHAYRALEGISFDGAYYRKDIGQKALLPPSQHNFTKFQHYVSQ